MPLCICRNEKTQIQALKRNQPMLPLGLGYVKGVTHETFVTVPRHCLPT